MTYRNCRVCRCKLSINYDDIDHGHCAECSLELKRDSDVLEADGYFSRDEDQEHVERLGMHVERNN